MEDLRITRKINYIPKKEIILSINIDDINKIIKSNDYDKIVLNNSEYLLVNDHKIINNLKNKL